MAIAEQAAPFVAKWRAREAEMAWAEVFCPRSQTDRFALWGALLGELRAATFELSDPGLIAAKTAWWAEEALRSEQGNPMHPLTQALAQPGLPWRALANALVSVVQAEPARPAERDAAIGRVAPLAGALAAMEAALFGGDAGNAARALAVHLLAERLHAGDGAQVPLMLLARHGLTAAVLTQPQGVPALCDWALDLRNAQPESIADATLFRRARTAFDGWRLGAFAAGRTPPRIPPFTALRLAWRAARAGANG